MPSQYAQGGFGLELKLNGTAVVSLVDLDQLRFMKTLVDITGHDSEDGYYDAEPSGQRRLEPFDCTLVWDRLEATHEAVVTAFESNAASTFVWSDPISMESISFGARIGSMSRILRQEDVYVARVQIRPVQQPTITQQYYLKVLDTLPITYWPLWDLSGSEAESLVSGIPNGAITGCLLNQPGIGDGKTSFRFDGVLDYVNIYSTALESAIDGDLGSMIIWFKANTGLWIGSKWSQAIYIRSNLSETLRLLRGYSAGNFTFGRHSSSVTKTGVSTLDWVCVCITWDKTADEMKAFWNGVQEGSTQTGLAAWLGTTLSSTQTAIGSRASGTLDVWDGWLAHAVLWDKVLTPAQALDLATI